MSHVILITGANRGIGKGLTAHYLARENTTVIGTVRQTTPETTKELHSLPKGHASQLILVSMSLDNPSSAELAMSEIRTQHHIAHIDTVISNAGICNHWGGVVEMADADVLSHLEVNTLGPLRLFRATVPLLQKAVRPKFIYISTLLSSLQGIGNFPSLTAGYGMSKVAGNYLLRKIDEENEYLVTLSIDPGLVQTDMGARSAQLNGMDKAPVTIEESVRGITRQIDAADKSTMSGQFVSYNGDRVPW